MNIVFVLLIVRVGLLAAVAAFYVQGLFIFFPVTANLRSWHAGAGVTAGGGALVAVTGCCSTTVAVDLRSELARQISQPMIASTMTPAITIITTRDCAPTAAGGMYDVVAIGTSFGRTSGREPAPTAAWPSSP